MSEAMPYQLSAEAVRLLSGKPIPSNALNMLRRMSQPRQVEAAEFMISTGNFSRSFVQALLAATRPEDCDMSRSKPISGLSQERRLNMQQELEEVLKDVAVTKNYGVDVLSLVVASSYISKLIGNKEIEGYLRRNHPEILQEFRAITSAESLDDSPDQPCQ
jgi:hypothetical protein